MDRFKPGKIPPRYDEVNLGSSGGDGARYSAPWWKNKKVWIGVAAVVIIAIIIGVAVGVTQGKKSSYPDYSQLTYTLKDTCEFYFLFSVLVSSSIFLAFTRRIQIDCLRPSVPQQHI